VGPDVALNWEGVPAADLRDYSVYRAGSSGVTPVPLNFLGSAADTTLIDTGAPGTALYYVVTAVDVHENESPPSTEAGVSPASGIVDGPALPRLTVLPNRPNPFAASTELRVGLPVPSDIAIDIYDIAGRRVNSLVVRDATAGWRSIPFAGRDRNGRRLTSGVYFYRVAAAGRTVTTKMIIAR
jgi:hypothetical protein